MRKVPTKTGRQVQFINESDTITISFSDKMKVKIDSSAGRREYSKRLGAIEPVFGNITVNKGMNQCSGQLKPHTFLKEFSYSIGDKSVEMVKGHYAPPSMSTLRHLNDEAFSQLTTELEGNA